jgi:rSAM/selenodomain-associated transferase 2
MTRLSIIIPTLNEAEHLPLTLRRARDAWPEAEVLVVDGGSADGTLAAAEGAGARVVCSPAGRGLQMRRGAEEATGDWLFFLHADTRVPREACELGECFMAGTPDRVATFRLRFDSSRWFLRCCGWFTRFDTVWTRFGDQGILVSREHYERLGGMPAWPLFEDVEFLRRARRLAPVVSLPAAVVTSARRFEQRGYWRQQWLNTRLLIKFLRGESPIRLAALYGNRRTSSRGHEKNLV